MHDSMREQLEGLEFSGTDGSSTVAETEERTAPKPTRKRKAKPNPAKTAKKVTSPLVKELVSIMVEEEIPPEPEVKQRSKQVSKPVQSGKNATAEGSRRDLLLLQLSGVNHCGVIGNLAIVAHLREDGTRFLRMRFDFTRIRRARWEVRILPVGIEHGQGWISCFHDGKSAMAVHVYDLRVMGYSADRP